jgi:hypothetical protein
MKRKFILLISAFFLFSLIGAVYLISSKHTTESTLTITGNTALEESNFVYEDVFTSGEIDVSNANAVILDNITIQAQTPEDLKFVYYPIITNKDSNCDFSGDVVFEPVFITKENKCINFCEGGYTPLMAIVEDTQPLENNSVVNIKNIELNKIQVKISIKKNACNQEIYLKTELSPVVV